jgi:hypothetical protein
MEHVVVARPAWDCCLPGALQLPAGPPVAPLAARAQGRLGPGAQPVAAQLGGAPGPLWAAGRCSGRCSRGPTCCPAIKAMTISNAANRFARGCMPVRLKCRCRLRAAGRSRPQGPSLATGPPVSVAGPGAALLRPAAAALRVFNRGEWAPSLHVKYPRSPVDHRAPPGTKASAVGDVATAPLLGSRASRVNASATGHARPCPVGRCPAQRSRRPAASGQGFDAFTAVEASARYSSTRTASSNSTTPKQKPPALIPAHEAGVFPFATFLAALRSREHHAKPQRAPRAATARMPPRLQSILAVACLLAPLVASAAMGSVLKPEIRGAGRMGRRMLSRHALKSSSSGSRKLKSSRKRAGIDD